MSEICKLKSIVPRFSNFEEGGPSDTPEGNHDSAKDNTELTDHELINDHYYDDDHHQDLAILKSIWHFNCNNGKPIAVCLQETQDCTRPSTARVMVREIWGNNWLRILIPTRRILGKAENSSSEENASGNRTANAHKESVDSRIGSLASRAHFKSGKSCDWKYSVFNSESEITQFYFSPTSSPPINHHPPSNLEIEQLLYLVQEPIISEPPKDEAVDETEDQKATGKRKLPASEELYQWKPVFPKIEEKGKRPMSELYE
ncbi:hypothetical protein HAX54_051698 [Datura stramonium]|uniref:Uncharacterized protein n=1 Tax=Datura stramonium TaxID=4076 RepID=A0ABS8SYN7_DATST|nr:hypothetical protein [Datura stramonium]